MFAEKALFFSKSSLQGEISMMENNTCESFEPLKTLDLPDILAHMVEPELKSSKPLIYESPKSSSKPSLIPTSVIENFPRFSQIY